jgi:hypothetical protein
MRHGVLKLIISVFFTTAVAACGDVAIGAVDHACPVNPRSGDSGCGAY